MHSPYIMWLPHNNLTTTYVYLAIRDRITITYAFTIHYVASSQQPTPVYLAIRDKTVNFYSNILNLLLKQRRSQNLSCHLIKHFTSLSNHNGICSGEGARQQHKLSFITLYLRTLQLASGLYYTPIRTYSQIQLQLRFSLNTD